MFFNLSGKKMILQFYHNEGVYLLCDDDKYDLILYGDIKFKISSGRNNNIIYDGHVKLGKAIYTNNGSGYGWNYKCDIPNIHHFKKWKKILELVKFTVIAIKK